MSNNTSNGAPSWAKVWQRQYTSQVAHAFVFHFNVRDITAAGLGLQAYITKVLASSQTVDGSPLMDIIVTYDRANGLVFPLDSMRQRFMDMLGLSGREPSQQDDMLNALLGNQGGQPQAEELPRRPGQVLPLLDTLLHSTGIRSTVIINHPETLAPNADVAMLSPEDRESLIILQGWGSDPILAAAGQCVILITDTLSSIHPGLTAASSRYESITVDLPNREQRLVYIGRLSQSQEFTGIDWQISEERLANGTAGLGLVHIRDILLRARQTGTLTWSLVKERKDSIIASEFADVLEMIEPTYGWERIGGLAHVKDFFQRSVINPIQSGRYSRVPMGVLMTGPAGTGKSAVAVAVAKEAGVNAVSLNMSRILGQYVGNSERNLEKAIQAIESLAPTIVFIDEIDQTVSRSEGGDSGVGSRIFKRLLEFMSDTQHRGRVVFLAATNRPDLMDAALRRPGRFDKKIPFLVPDETERGSIIQVMAKAYGLDIQNFDLTTLIDACDGWTGAEIEAAAVKAVELVEDESLITTDALAAAFERLSPSTADIQFMTLLAIKETNDTDLLPTKYRKLLANRTALDKQIEQAGRSGDRSLNLL